MLLITFSVATRESDILVSTHASTKNMNMAPIQSVTTFPPVSQGVIPVSDSGSNQAGTASATSQAIYPGTKKTPKFPCRHCGLLLTTRGGVRRHEIAKHTSQRAHLCPFASCKFATLGFARPDALTFHLRTTHHDQAIPTLTATPASAHEENTYDMDEHVADGPEVIHPDEEADDGHEVIYPNEDFDNDYGLIHADDDDDIVQLKRHLANLEEANEELILREQQLLHQTICLDAKIDQLRRRGEANGKAE